MMMMMMMILVRMMMMTIDAATTKWYLPTKHQRAAEQALEPFLFDDRVESVKHMLVIPPEEGRK